MSSMAWADDVKLGDESLSIIKAGAQVNTTLAVAANADLLEISKAVQGYICTKTRRDWVTAYADLSTQIKECLNELLTSMVAKYLISYDLTGYFTGEAQTLLNVHDDIVNDCLAILKDFKATELKTPSP